MPKIILLLLWAQIIIATPTVRPVWCTERHDPNTPPPHDSHYAIIHAYYCHGARD